MVSLLFCFLYWCFHKCGVNKSLLFQWMQCDCGKIPNWTLALSILCKAKKVDRTLTLMSVVCRSLVSLDDSCFVFSFWRFVALVILVMIDKASKFQKSFLTLWVSDGCQLWVKLQEISKKKKKKTWFFGPSAEFTCVKHLSYSGFLLLEPGQWHVHSHHLFILKW